MTINPRLLVLVIAAMAIIGCSGGQTEPQTTQEKQPSAPVEQVTQEEPPEQSPVSTATPQLAPRPTETLHPTVTPEPTATTVPTTTPEPTMTPMPTATPEPTVAPMPTATPVPPTPIPPRPTATPRNEVQEVFQAIGARAEELDSEEKRLTDEINRNAIRFRVGEVTVEEVCVNWQELTYLYLDYHTFLSEIIAEHVDSLSSPELRMAVTVQTETESLLRDWLLENADVLDLCGIRY